jgi:hypothetical protein
MKLRMHVTAFSLARYRARRGSSAERMALVGLLVWAACAAAEPPPAAAPPAAPATQTKPPPGGAAADRATTVVKCTSVVIRNCRAQFVVDPAAAGASQQTKGRTPPGRWEAVRSADPDSDEVLVEEDRLRDPALHEVFESYLGAGPDALITRNAAGGARCTTIASTGATFCSHPGTQAPTSSLPHSDFSDGAF